MHSITLIATGHSERGVCNSNELYKIIESIAPEVIFEEVPENKFDALYKGLLKESLEVTTIKKYLKKYPVAHFPVDLEINEIAYKGFKPYAKKMFDTINQHSPEYNNLSFQQDFLIEHYGFAYLNNDQFGQLFKRKLELEEYVIKMLNDDILSQAYKTWLDIIDRRENEMIKKIYNYSDLNRYDSALFLVGAAHRKPIIDKIPEFEKSNSGKLNWNFRYFK